MHFDFLGLIHKIDAPTLYILTCYETILSMQLTYSIKKLKSTSSSKTIRISNYDNLVESSSRELLNKMAINFFYIYFGMLFISNFSHLILNANSLFRKLS